MSALIKKIFIPALFFPQFSYALSPNVIDLDSSSYRSLVVSGNWTTAIQTAFNNLPATGGTVLFPASEHLKISSWVKIQNKANFIIDGNGSTAEYVAGALVASNYGGFSFENSSNYVFKNLTIDGNRDQRSPAETYAHSVFIIGGSNYTLENINVVDAVVDGFYIAASDPANASTYPKDGIILNCSSHNAYRQGMSVINAFNLNIIGGNFSGTDGTAPEAGIDIEANPATGLVSSRNIRIQGVTFENNDGYGVLISNVGQPKDISVRDSYFSANQKGAIDIGGSDITISGNSFVNFSESDSGIVNLNSTEAVARVSITDNHFRDITAIKPAIWLRAAASGYNGDVIITGNTFQNVNSVLSNYRKQVIFSNNSITSVNGASAAIALQNGSDAMVTGNSFKGTKTYAVWADGPSNRIINNTIVEHTFPDSGNYGAIRITGAGGGDNEIRNNVIRSTTATSSQYAIRIDSGATAVEVDNRCSGFAGTGCR